MLQDRYGLALSTSSEAAASAYRDGIDLMLAAWPGAGGTLDAAVAADPGFALAHAGRARLLAREGDLTAARRHDVEVRLADQQRAELRLAERPEEFRERAPCTSKSIASLSWRSISNSMPGELTVL